MSKRYSWGLALVILISLCLPDRAAAQRVGGVIDPAFNPADTGNIYSPVFFDSWVQFFSSHRRDLYFMDNRAARELRASVIPLPPSLYTGYELGHINASGSLSGAPTAHYHRVLRGVLAAEDGRPIAIGANEFTDSTNVIYLSKSYLEDHTRSTNVMAGLPLPFGAMGPFKAGLHRTDANRLFFWITTPADKDSTTEHLNTHLFELDTNFRVLSTVILPNFKARLSTFDATMDHVLLVGNEATQPSLGLPDVVLGTEKILSVEVTNLTPLGERFTLPASLGIQGPISFIHGSNDKIVIAGRMRLSATDSGQAVQRLMLNGQWDPGFASARFPETAKNYALHRLANGTILAAAWDTASNVNIMQCYTLGGAGGWSLTQSSTIDSLYRPGRPLFYHRGLSSWFCETGYLKVLNDDSYLFLLEDFYQPQYRFLVSPGQPPRSFGNPQGLVNLRINFQTNRTFLQAQPTSNQLLLRGGLLQYNGRVTPTLVVIRPDGTIDPAWKTSAVFKEPFVRPLYGWITGQYPTDSLVQIYTPRLCAGNRIQFHLQYSEYYGTLVHRPNDTVYTFAFDGRRVMTQQVLRASMGLNSGVRQLRDGSALATFLDDSLGNPGGGMGRGSWRNNVRTFYQIQANGEKGVTYGTLIPNRDLPDSLMGQPRMFRMINVDDRGGLWILADQSETSYDSTGSRNALIRLVPGRRPQVIVLDSNASVSSPLTITSLPGGRYRFIGSGATRDRRMPWPNGIITSRQVTTIDSLGRLVPDEDFTSLNPFTLVDAFGRRGGLRMTPFFQLPNGNYLARINHQSGPVRTSIISLLPNGELDPSFLPVTILVSAFATHTAVLGNRLFWVMGNQIDNPQTALNRDRFQARPYKNNIKAYLLNSNSNALAFVQGKVEQVPSPAVGCTPTTTPRPAIGMQVVSGTRVTFTDTAGRYVMVLDTGAHSVRQEIPNDFLQRQVCPMNNAPIGVALTRPGQVIQNQNFINQTYDCPRLTLQVQQGRNRLCSKNTIRASYRNEGTAAQSDVRLRLNLPGFMQIVSASAPYTIEADGSIVFPIGNLAPGQRGVIIIQDSVECFAPIDDQLTCLSMRLEPLALCGQLSQASLPWSGAWLDARATYEPASQLTRYRIINRGQAMTDSVRAVLSYSEAPSLVFRGRIRLASSDSVTLMAPASANGSSWLSLEQPSGSPLGQSSSMGFSGQGIVPKYLSFSDGWFAQQTYSACWPLRFSYDPNEKEVSPSRLTEPGNRLDYTIHFENLGNDTAFTVLVEDSLPAELDASTFTFTGSTHPCRVSLSKDGGRTVALFSFAPIALAAKRQDSVASKGSLTFSINTLRGVARGTWVENRAHIYFDRNPAVITEYSRVRIRPLEPGEPTSAAPLLTGRRLSLLPNPARSQVRVELPQSHSQSLITLTDLQGRVILKARAQGGLLMIPLGHLKPGYYLVRADGLPVDRLVIE